MSTPPTTNARPSGAPQPSAAGAAPPHSIEAEQSVLGAMLLSDRTHYAFVIEEGLKVEDFYRERHREVYESMLALFTAGESIDVLTVTEHLRSRGRLDSAGGQAEIDALTAAVPAVGNLRQYAQIVRDRALLRRLLTASYEIQASVHGHEAPPRELVEWAERAVLEVAHDDRQKDFRLVGEVLHAEVRKWQELSAEGRSLTGTPSGFADLDSITGGFQPGNLIIIAARPSMGKCIHGSALVYDPMTGARRRMDDVVALIEGGEEVHVASVGPDLRLRATRATAALRNGVRPLHRLTTRLGRRIEATANHPLLTIGGWRRLDELGPGSRVAVPRRLPRPQCEQAMPDHEIVMLAALVAEGSLTERTPRFCFGPDSPVLDEVQEAAAAFGTRMNTTSVGQGTATISAGRGAKSNPVRELCELHGLWGLRSAEKFVPDAIFGLDEGRLERFLAVLHACDGHAYAGDRLHQIGYSTISERLAHDVQHLLLRLGIVSRIRTLRRPVYDGTGRVAREVLITGQEGLETFCSRVRVCGKSAQATGDDGLAALATSDLWWDEVASIEPIGEQQTFDITVPGDHNFVADDVVVHNSALVTNMAENVALNKDNRRPVALFSLEMSEAELAQRFIASQASIKGDDLRKGRLRDETKWKRVLRTASEYDAAPLYVDDSSDIGIMDVRAKARRLHQQAMAEYGGLGLVIVDYLQLMRADSR
ncbi:MAG TPA: DnaB-like helicase C-terminal domain-containing protein, partial [Solirubrobacteraceae bacterium]|nr:DnaB-like helicase C-terminal domain-containing protein [Solirubrobacteraceae bacterium]